MKACPAISLRRRLLRRTATRLGILAATVFPAVHATDYVWGVTGTQSWATPTNWTPNGTPAALDTIAIGGTAATTVTLNGAKSISSIAVSNTSTTAITSVSGPFSLTLGAGGMNIATGAGVATFGSTTAASNVNWILGASQTWSNSGGTPLIRGNITGTGLDLTISGNFDLRSHAGGTPTINLGTGILTQTRGGFEIGSGVNTIGGFVLKGGNVFARNVGNFGTTGTVTLGDSVANTTAIQFRMLSGTWPRPVVLASGTTGTILIDNLGTPNSPIMTGGVTGTNNLTLQSTISSAAGALTMETAAIDFTGQLTLRNQGTGSASAATGTVTVNSPITSKVTSVTVTDITTGTRGVQRAILGNAANAYTGDTTVSSPGRLDLGTSEVIPHGTGKGNLIVNGNLVLATGTGNTTETVNGLEGSGNGLISRTGATGTSTLVVGGNDATSTFAGVISNGAGKVALTKTGTGTLTLNNINTYTGLTTVSAGTLKLEMDQVIADAASIDIAAGAFLNLTETSTPETIDSLRFDGVPQASGKWGRIGSIAALDADFESDRITGDGLLDVTNALAPFYWDGTGTAWESATAWSVSASDETSDPSVAPGAGNLTVFGGNDVATDQSIVLNGDQATAGMSFTSPVTFTFLGGDANHTLTVGGLTVNAASKGPVFGSPVGGQQVNLLLSGNQTWTNASTTGALTAENGVDLGTGTLTMAGAGSTQLKGEVSGSGGIIKTGTGNLDLLAANTFSGSVSLQAAGIVKLGTATSLGTTSGNTTVGSGATLDLNGQAVGEEGITLGVGSAGNLVNNDTANPASLAGGININFNSNAGGAGDLTLSGVIVQTGGAKNLTKTGTGKLTLTNANTYTGTTTIGNGTGTVAITNGAALGTGPVNISRGGTTTGTLELSGDITVANTFTFASATSFSAVGSTAQVRNVSGNNTLTGTLTLNNTGGNGINLESVSGLLTVSNTVTSTINDNTRQLALGGAGDGVVSGNIIDTGTNKFSVIKSGTGKWTLSGTNSYTGSTNVNAGTLVLTKNGSIADTAAVNVGVDGILHLDYTGSDTIGSLVLAGAVMGPGTYTASHPSGRITGTGSLFIPGADAFTPWIDTFTFAPGADKTRAGDPDGDGLSNELEFALDGDPSSGVATGKVVAKIDAGHMTLTLPVRTGATFNGSGPLVSLPIEGMVYRIEGDDDLSGFTGGVEEVAALTTNMPGLTGGWTYRTFRLTDLTTAASKGFLRVDVSPAP